MCCKIIEKYPKYSVSIYGEVINNKTGRILKARNDGSGYLNVTLCYEGLKRDLKVHRLVLETFCPLDSTVATLYQCHHKDGDRCNNALDNLEWVLASEHKQESTKYNKYLSQENVLNILDDYFVYDLTKYDICEKYKIEPKTIFGVTSLLTYRRYYMDKLEYYQAKRSEKLAHIMDKKEIAYVKYKFLIDEEIISRDGISQKAIEQQCKNAKVELGRDFDGNKEEMKRRGIISSSTGDGDENED